MITMICGDVGTGKTALNTFLLCRHATGESGRAALADSRRRVKFLNANGYTFSLPDRVPIYSDYTVCPVRNGYRLRPLYHIDGFFLALSNDFHPTMFLPPYSLVGFDEGHRYFNSRVKNKELGDFVVHYYATHRHWDLNFILTCQRPSMIDLIFRGICEQFIFIEKLDVKKDSMGRVKWTAWDCIEFNNTDSAEAYSHSKHPSGAYKRTTYKYNGNIWACYDSKGMFPMHLKDREFFDFPMEPSSITGYNLDQVQDFNSKHGYSPPETFYKPKGSNKNDPLFDLD